MNAERYIVDQLIAYIGNKRKLVSLIRNAIEAAGVRGGTFYDAFAGSTVVSRLAKTLGYRVIANDWEPYSHYIGLAYIRNNRPPDFHVLGGLQSAINTLNQLEPVRGYIARHYCPEDDEDCDPDSERMFYTQENGRRIDAIREQIASWKASGAISEDEEAVLFAPLIFQAAYCSNTSGVFKGFHRGWGGATKTAWYRIRSTLTLAAPVFWDNGQKNLVYREDANSLLDEIECDIAYLDPPYNQHQYGANYHLLNTVALWDKPRIGARFKARHPHNGKSAIRKDWRTERRSLYCYRSSALAAFHQLVNGIKARFILVSYSTDGIIPFDDLLGILADRGELSAVTQKYKRYRVSSQRPSAKSHNVEFVAIVDTGRSASRSNVQKVKHQVYAEHINTVEESETGSENLGVIGGNQCPDSTE
ncbi:MAG TPA: DNA adenine methylase [Armatimonadota bacterium]|nr:DNA adenine methylase [Armatimonadota bacterium]